MAKKIFLLCAVVALIVPVVSISSYCTGTYNNKTVATDDPVLVRVVKNGKLFVVGSSNPRTKIAHVFGSSYEMG